MTHPWPVDCAFERCWSTFLQSGDTLTQTPGVRAAWARGRTNYAVLVLRVPAASSRVQRVADRLDSRILPISHADVHITVWVAGFPAEVPAASDEIRPADLSHALEVLRGWPSPRLSILGSNAFRSAVFCSVLDEHGDLAALRTELAAHLPPEVRFGPLVPHVTVGRFARVCETETIATLLEPLRELPPLPCRPATLDWVALDATRDDPPLRTVAQIPLELT